VTIMIQMHGKVFTYELDSRTASVFNNVRLLCKAIGFNDYISMPKKDWEVPGELAKKYQHNLTESTYNMMDNEPGDLIGNVTYDKTLSTTIGEEFWDKYHPTHLMTKQVQGLYLISIHDGFNLIYPSPNTWPINLLKIENLNNLANYFHTVMPNIVDMSTPFPNQRIYINEESRVNSMNIPENEKQIRIRQIRKQFIDLLKKWNLTLESNTKIDKIKMSVAVELIKHLVGNNCIINLLDYSCNSPTIYIPPEEKYGSKYYKLADIEQGNDLKIDYGGNKRRIGKNKGNKKTRGKKKDNKRRYKNKSYKIRGKN